MYCIKSWRRKACGKEDGELGKSEDIDWDELQSMAYGILGMTPDVFWNLTYYEFCLALKGYRLRVEQGMAESWWTAHLSAIGYHQPKRFPKLQQIIRPQNELSDTERRDTKNFLKEIAAKKKKKLKDNK